MVKYYKSSIELQAILDLFKRFEFPIGEHLEDIDREIVKEIDFKNRTNKMTIQEQIEESCLLAADSISEQAKDQGTKTIMDLFKSAILKKYKVAFDYEVSQGEVHKKNVDKAIDFFFSDICATIRQLPKMSDDYKEQLILTAKQQLVPFKESVIQILVNKGIQII